MFGQFVDPSVTRRDGDSEFVADPRYTQSNRCFIAFSPVICQAYDDLP